MYGIASPVVSTRLMADQHAVLFQADTDCVKYLNATGLFIWRQLDGSVSVRQLTERLSRRFDVVSGKQACQDIQRFLLELSKLGFARMAASRLPEPARRPIFPDMDDAPQSLDISLTGKCNLACRYCFYSESMRSRPDLAARQWKAFFEELGRLGVRRVCLSGGELFVRPDVWELIDGVIDNRMRYAILTNGTLITEKLLAGFDMGKRRIRLDSIQVSIDGSCARIHDRSRGKGSFDRAIAGLRLLKTAGFPVTARVTVNRYNVNDLENTCRLLLEDIGLESIGTNEAMPLGAGCSNRQTIALLPVQQLQSMERLSRLADIYQGRVTASAGPLAKYRQFLQMAYAEATGAQPSDRQMGYLTACRCMFSKLSVHHDGVITPCNMLPDMALGRINSDSLSRIWRTHPVLRTLRARENIPMHAVPGCEDCRWAPYCNGGCAGVARALTGNINCANPMDCYRDFLAETGLRDIRDNNNRLHMPAAT